jgi:hypothetical protein
VAAVLVVNRLNQRARVAPPASTVNLHISLNASRCPPFCPQRFIGVLMKSRLLSSTPQ